MSVLRSIPLFLLAGLAKIGGGRLVWQGVLFMGRLWTVPAGRFDLIGAALGLCGVAVTMYAPRGA